MIVVNYIRSESTGTAGRAREKMIGKNSYRTFEGKDERLRRLGFPVKNVVTKIPLGDVKKTPNSGGEGMIR